MRILHRCFLYKVVQLLVAPQIPLYVHQPINPIHAKPGHILHQQLGLTVTHVEDAVAAVIRLLLALVRKEIRVNYLGSITANACHPAAE